MNVRPQVEMVLWVDSCSKHGWQGKGDYPKVATIRSFGYVISENDDQLLLSAHFVTDMEDAYPHADVMAIPKRCILDRKNVTYDR